MSHYNVRLLKAVVGLLLVFGYAGQAVAQTLLPNGDFETGNLTGWTAGGINGGVAVVVQEGTCFSANNTRGLTLDGSYAINVRSSGPAPTNSIGIVTSEPFEAGADVSFRALSENDPAAPVPNPVTLEVRLLDGAGSVLLSRIIQTNIVTLNTGFTSGCQGTPVDGTFSAHSIDTSALAGQSIRLEFRQHTNVSGKGFFTLLDDVKVTPFVNPPAPSLTAITVAPANPTINVGDSQAFTATGSFSDASTQALSSTSNWTPLNASGAPALSGHTAVYHGAANRMMVFGGSNSPSFGCTGFAPGSTFFNDTWVLTNANGRLGASSWNKLATNTPPPARWRHSSVYDAANNRMIVFGGEDANGFRQDVWVLANANGQGGASVWQQLTPGGTPPGGRTCHAAVYDAHNNRMMIFAGEKGAGQIGNDVWVLTHANGLGGTPQWVQLTTGVGPTPRIFPVAVYDAATNRLIVHGGGAGDSVQGLSDTWVLSNANGLEATPSTWTALPAGPARAGHSGVYDPVSNRLTVFGGCDGSCFNSNDVWVLSNANGADGYPSRWTKRTITGAAPGARVAHSAVYDAPGKRMTVFGGCPNGACPANDAWVLHNADGGVAWESSADAVAGISADGLAQGTGAGTTTITARVDQISGNTTLTVQSPDNIAPITSASVSPAANGNGWHHSDVTVTLQAVDNAGGSGVRAITYSLSGAQSGGGSVTGDNAAFTVTAEGVTTVSYHAVDKAGNVESAQTLTVRIDKTQPVLTAPANLTVEATSPAGAVVDFTPTATDGLSGIDSVVSIPASGSTFALGATQVEVTATDKAGNTATDSFTVTVQDTTGPHIIPPADVIAEATSAAGAIVHYPPATVTDAVDPNPTVSYSQASGTLFPLGLTKVTITARDTRGNSSEEDFFVTVRDTTPPSIGVVQDIVAEATSPDGAIVHFELPPVSDLVDPAPVVTVSPPSDSTFALGVTPVTITAADRFGNVASKSFTVKVQDTTPPEVTIIPADLTFEATSPDGAVIDYRVIAKDLVDPNPTIVFLENPPGSRVGLGGGVARCHVYDRYGNGVFEEPPIKIPDTTPPSATLSLSPATLWPPDHKLVSITPTLTASDLAGPVTIAGPVITSNEPINGTGDGDTAPDWMVIDTYHFQLRAERRGGGTGRVYTVRYTVTDRAGNATVVSATVSVPHNQ